MKKKLKNRPRKPKLERVLLEVNKARACLGKKPLVKLPRGEPGNSCKCVIAKSLGHHVHVDESNVYFPNSNYREKLRELWDDGAPPDSIRRFIVYFDSGRYPELIAKGQEGLADPDWLHDNTDWW